MEVEDKENGPRVARSGKRGLGAPRGLGASPANPQAAFERQLQQVGDDDGCLEVWEQYLCWARGQPSAQPTAPIDLFVACTLCMEPFAIASTV